MSFEDDQQLERLVWLTCFTKQDYTINWLLERDVVVQRNPQVYQAIWDQISAFPEELVRINTEQSTSDDLNDTIRFIYQITESIKQATLLFQNLERSYVIALLFIVLNSGF